MNEKDYITREEHSEFARRVDEENRRQNKRIDNVEAIVQGMSELTSTVRELATSMKNMAKEQERQGERLEKIEGYENGNIGREYRISTLENEVKDVGDLAKACEKLAHAAETMEKKQAEFFAEQEKIDKRISALEGQDGEMWRTVIRYALTAGVGAIIWQLIQIAGVF